MQRIFVMLVTFFSLQMKYFFEKHLTIYAYTYLPTYLPNPTNLLNYLYMPTYLHSAILPTFLPLSTYLHTYLPTYLPTSEPLTPPLFCQLFHTNFALWREPITRCVVLLYDGLFLSNMKRLSFHFQALWFSGRCHSDLVSPSDLVPLSKLLQLAYKILLVDW